MCRAIAECAKENSLAIQMHISETEKEHEECKMRRGGRTPIAFAKDTGMLDSPFCAAHCVFVTPEDMDIMREKGVFASHNPVSNLKLASGVMPLPEMLARGVSVALGTDGAASNNRLDLLREMQTALLLSKGTTGAPDRVRAEDAFVLATENGARAQGRANCGRIAEGYRADLALIDTDALNNIPLYDTYSALAYSVRSTDVRMTAVDGKILYLDGEFKTLDVEKLRHTAKHTIAHYFD
jgi:5-methylthioadenosine/S-adenosylhomocysteine deaminase